MAPTLSHIAKRDYYSLDTESEVHVTYILVAIIFSFLLVYGCYRSIHPSRTVEGKKSALKAQEKKTEERENRLIEEAIQRTMVMLQQVQAGHGYIPLASNPEYKPSSGFTTSTVIYTTREVGTSGTTPTPANHIPMTNMSQHPSPSVVYLAEPTPISTPTSKGSSTSLQETSQVMVASVDQSIPATASTRS